MSSVTSSAKNRTSNGGKDIPAIPSSGTRIQRSVIAGLNLGATIGNFGGDVVNLFSGHNWTAAATDVGHAFKAAWKYANTDPAKYQGSSVTNQSPNSKYKKFGLQTPGGGTTSAKANAGNPTVIPIQADPDQSYSWNLPPHEWSLPTDPSEVYGDSVDAPTAFSHSYRRGKIFLARKYVGTTATTDPKTGTKTFDRQGKNNYGFQFLWNPETFSQSTSVNWGITPNQNDATAILTGLTSANSTIDFTIRIDRTNDFAAAKKLNNQINNPVQETSYFKGLQKISKYYQKGQAPNSDTDFANNMETKISDLLNRGTEADLEFLYKTINGDGYKSSWGTTTSNISFLLPTIIRLDLGPQRLVGMIQSVNVNHLAFTREMVPIRTDVQLSVDLRAAAGITTSNFGVDPTSAASVATQ